MEWRVDVTVRVVQGTETTTEPPKQGATTSTAVTFGERVAKVYGPVLLWAVKVAREYLGKDS